MSARIIPVEPFDMIVFGATGDLAARKLFPALYHRDFVGQLPDDARIIGTSRRELTTADFTTLVETAISEHVGIDERDPAILKRFLSRLDYVAVDAAGDNGWPELKKVVGAPSHRIRAFYLAVGPDIFAPLTERLGRHGLACEGCRVVVEKPIGRDGESARAINDAIGRVFEESQIFRIDHYLGKETVQNLMALRFANALFEPVWNAAHIDHVQITVAETLGLEGRAGYYESSGALRDMVQNHILQLLCLAAMEPPTSLSADSVRDEKLKILRSLKPIGAGEVAQRTVRGQYRAGASSNGPVKSFAEELGKPQSQTETFVALKAEIENWRWKGAPFYLRTGKRLASRVSEIVVTFRQVPHSIFEAAAGPLTANRLVMRLQPDEGVKLWLMIKDPGPGGMRLRHVPLDMSFAESFGVRPVDAYERLLMDVVRGNQTLFMRRDEVEAAWAWIDPILEVWQTGGDTPKAYTAGTWGPSTAVALIERDGRTWHDSDEQ
ncbi:MAG: glucose-6-phosphate dehydrogenase [Hyphomicrobiaceae bacterium]